MLIFIGLDPCFFHHCISSHSYLSRTDQLLDTLWVTKIVIEEKQERKIIIEKCHPLVIFQERKQDNSFLPDIIFIEGKENLVKYWVHTHTWYKLYYLLSLLQGWPPEIRLMAQLSLRGPSENHKFIMTVFGI